MPFERLLVSCLLPDTYGFQENKTFVEIKPVPGETILFFCIDPNSKGHPNCKKSGLRGELWGNQPGQPICDLLVFYAKGDRRVLCFVELKDNKSDLNHATEQVINTYQALRPYLKLTQNYTVQAFLIGYAGSVYEQYGQYEKALEKEFKGNCIYNGTPDEFADFLRGNEIKSKPKSKGNRK